MLTTSLSLKKKKKLVLPTSNAHSASFLLDFVLLLSTERSTVGLRRAVAFWEDSQCSEELWEEAEMV
ncbi:hypothetical protein DEO72_LG1g3165 [Vigna unguiculata]|uniref:Uncharacterized protein n=1 Tax=Vigna unguiculata TaxID=3917 RepID=A0A4D6KSJ3_VIGUN|nr:hypothetical protein DEO72_LG1g3165 [Vigna unguiculata]